MSDAETLNVYANKADDYAAMVGGSNKDRTLDLFLSGLPAGGSVLDWGCGPGNSAAKMIAAGFQVTATDATPEFAQKARALHGVEVRVETFADLDAQHAFDGIWASFSLLHAPKAAMPGHLAQAHRALRPGGRLCLGLKTGTGEHRDGIGRFYAYYSAEEITGLLAAAGFTVSDQSTGVTTGLDGTEAPWIVLHAHG